LSENVREKILSGKTVVFKEQNVYSPVLIDRILNVFVE